MELSVTSGAFTVPEHVRVTGSGSLESAFDVTGLAVSSTAAAGSAVARLSARLSARLGADSPKVTVDRNLASLWFGMSFTPSGWDLPSPWDALAGDYPCADGWIRLHTNAPHHRAAALAVLGLPPSADRTTVGAAVERWSGEELESVVVAANGCAAFMRSQAQWLAHPQGKAVAAEPLIHWGAPRAVPALKHDAGARGHSRRTTSLEQRGAQQHHSGHGTPDRPLGGVRILDLTRVIAGPVATRFLAMYGAQVLRIDPPGWQEPALEPEMTIGKYCARLDLKTAEGLATLHELLAGADIFIHGYRPDALAKLGLSEDALAGQYPMLVNVALNAYGWSGPWANRRGFDSLVQMSCGIAEAGMSHFARELPVPLPVQALDHATGYLVAAAAVDAWRERLDGTVRSARLSLARTAVELMRSDPSDPHATIPTAESFTLLPEETRWGQGFRLPLAVHISGLESETQVQAQGYGWARPDWP